jgi:hypothetical protein
MVNLQITPMKQSVIVLFLIFFISSLFLLSGTWQTSHQKQIDVHLQDATNPPFQYYAMREDKADITLIEAAQTDSTYVVVSSGHGFTAGGEYIAIFEGDFYVQTKVKSVSNDTIHLGRKVDIPFSTSSVVVRGSINLNVDGSSTVQEFVFDKHTGTTPIDIQTIRLIVWNGSLQGDESTFGDLAEITNGLYAYMDGPVDFSFGNPFCSNGDFRDFGSKIEYTDRGPAGTYTVIINFNIKDEFGPVVRLDPTTQVFKILVQDDIDALTRFRVVFLGHLTEGE